MDGRVNDTTRRKPRGGSMNNAKQIALKGITMSKPMAHSHSRLNNYVGCPLSYKLLYIDKVGGDETPALQIGAAAHEFFEQQHKNPKYRYTHNEHTKMAD